MVGSLSNNTCPLAPTPDADSDTDGRGVFQTLTTTYAAEVTPVALRAYLTTYVNLCWVIGQLIASGILKGFLTNKSQWAYRIPFAIQWIWPIPIFLVCFFAPESPWWLVRKYAINTVNSINERK
jgi:MFS family permease